MPRRHPFKLRRAQAERDEGNKMIRKRKYITGKIRREIWEKFERTCQICGRETVLFGNTVSPFSDKPPCAVDHIKPFSLGGECVIENFQLLCITCNSKKGAR
jgi:5-methylcytosine-specific restriction endonuclease McrA